VLLDPVLDHFRPVPHLPQMPTPARPCPASRGPSPCLRQCLGQICLIKLSRGEASAAVVPAAGVFPSPSLVDRGATGAGDRANGPGRGRRGKAWRRPAGQPRQPGQQASVGSSTSLTT